MPNLGIAEIAIILVIVLVIFGPSRLPQLGGAIGKGINEFKRGVSGKDTEGDGDENQQTTQQEEDTKKL